MTTTQTTLTFTDNRPAGAPAEWVGGINYTLIDDASGTRVLGVYSYRADRYVMPGELVTVTCESGAVEDGAIVTFVGRTPYGDLAYETSEGRRHLVVWQVRPAVHPAYLS